MSHLCAAAYEAPLTTQDTETLGPSFPEAADRLVTAGRLRKRDGRWQLRGADFPAGKLSLRSASTDSFAIVNADGGELIGFVEAERAFSTVHPGAVYLHLGEPYEVEDLELDQRRAIVRRAEGDWYTQPKIDTETFIEETREERDALGVPLRFGIVSVMQEVVAYQRKRMADHEVIDLQTLDLPEQNFVTQALWYELPEEHVGELGPAGAARRAARGRAFPDRGPAADRDVRPLGHRRPVDELPPPDRVPDDLHLRRPPGRCRDHEAGLRGVRAPGRRRAPPAGRVPVRVRLPLLRAVAEVRQPERAAVQGRRARPDGKHDGRGRWLTSGGMPP